MHRFTLPSPQNWNQLNIYNGKLEQNLVDWRFSLDWDTLKQLKPYGIRTDPELSDVLTVMGSHATLWIDSCKGTIAPMDSQPQGWTYGNRKTPVSPALFWQWHPDEISKGKLLTEANAVPTSLEEWLKTQTTLFKTLVPSHLAERHGQLTGIEAIPVYRLPGMLKSQCSWTFETEALQRIPVVGDYANEQNE